MKPYKYQEAKAVPIRVIFSDPIKVMHNLVAFVPKGIYAYAATYGACYLSHIILCITAITVIETK